MKTTTQRLFKPVEPAAYLMPISDHPEYSEICDQLRALEAAHAEKQRERQRLLARIRGEKTKRSTLERAQDLLRGGRVDAIPPASALLALDEEIAILRGAITTKTRELDAISSELSYAEAMRARPEYLSALNSMHAHLQAALDDYGRAASIPLRLHQRGFRVSSAIMPDLMPPSLRAVGNYELAAMRRELDAMEARR